MPGWRNSVDAADSKSAAERCKGSSPLPGTKIRLDNELNCSIIHKLNHLLGISSIGQEQTTHNRPVSGSSPECPTNDLEK